MRQLLQTDRAAWPSGTHPKARIGDLVQAMS